MKKYWITLLLLASPYLHATESLNESNVEGAASPTDGTSRGARADKRWGWVGQAGNLTLVNRATFGIGAGVLYYFNGRNVSSIELGSGSNYDFVSSFGGDTVNSHDTRFGVYHKIFVANSFYFKGGLETNQVHYNVVHYPLFSGPSYSQSADIRLYSVFLGLGNHWQIRKLTIGCDWAALMVPFANSGYKEESIGTPFSTWDLKARLTAVGLVVGRFYIGMSY